MELLLDTHVFLWFITGDNRLPITWKQALQRNLILVTSDVKVQAYPVKLLSTI